MVALLVIAVAARAAGTATLATAEGLFDAHRFPEARIALEGLLSADPRNADIHYYLGEIALERDDTDTAVRELESATALAPNSGRNHFALGTAYGRSAQKAGLLTQFTLARRCLAEFQKAVAAEPRNVDFHEGLFEYYWRAPAFVGGGASKAAAEAAAINALDAKRGHQAYAALYIAAGKFDLALGELDQALRASPGDYGTLYQIGRLAALSGQHLDRGVAALRLCLTIPATAANPPHSAVQWRLGNVLEKRGDLAGARLAYQAALKIDPNFAQASEALKKLP